jgi:hypothetical protein
VSSVFCYHPAALAKRERFLSAGLVLLLLAVRAASFFRYRFDSDEPQHLHVAWGWTQGLIQYHDLFDNHAPLFHIVTSPFLAFFGERANILFYMRGVMIPIWLFVCAATFIIARRLYTPRIAAWSVLLLNLFPAFFLKSIEYRTDNLWVGLWMAAFLVLTGGTLTKRRMFAVGLLLGTATCVSLKTSLLLASLLLAGVAMWWFTVRPRSWRNAALIVLPALLGLVIVPSIVAITFARLGAWPDLLYCNFTFNELISKSRPHAATIRLFYPIALAVSFYAARRLSFLAVLSMFYISTLVCWWPLISSRDFLAILPIFAIVLTAWLDRMPLRAPALAAIALLALFELGRETHWLKNETRELTTMMDQVLHLTRPGEPLMDYKGETIYRWRPYYFILEAIGRAELKQGVIPDTIARDMINVQCHVAQADGAFWPRDARQFLLKHYIDVGRLRAAGNVIEQPGDFEVAVPGIYVIIGKNGQAHGTLDGAPYRDAIELAPGIHHFDRATDEQVVWLWAPAYQRGFSPFHLRDRDF